MKKIKSFIKKHSDEVVILLISLVALIIGTLAINFIISFLIIGIIDTFLLLPKFQKKKRTSKKGKKTVLKVAFLSIFIIGILVLLSGIGFISYIVAKAPKFDSNKLYNKESTIIYDKHGNEIAKLGAELREKVSFNELPEVLVDAIIATEDARFFQHNGFDLPRFLIASFGQMLGRDSGGASTLTMQIVKNNFTDPNKDSGLEGVIRKFTDIYMAIFKLEKKLTKKEILELYVNTYYLGDGAYGVEQASMNYFGKSVTDISLAEAALLAGLFNAPNAYDPYINPTLAEERRQTVLYLMERHGYITEEEKLIAKTTSVDKIVLPKEKQTRKYGGFIDAVIDEVEIRTGNNPYIVPMQIYTTMDPDMQDVLDEIMSGDTSKYKWENELVQAGVALIDHSNGSITAIGAGRNRKGERTLNFATMTNNQIGSSAKPLFDYGPGIEYENWSTYQMFTDEPHSYSDGTTIKNWDGKFKGFMTMREALIDSRNITAVKAFQQNNNNNIKKFVKGLGLSPVEQPNGKLFESHALGGYNGENPVTMAAAYAAFANGGYYIEPHSFDKIIYRDTGDVKEFKYKMTRVMSEETAFMVTDMLRSTGKSYGGLSGLRNIDFGAKTGTTNLDEETRKDYGFPASAAMDLWVAGITPKYSMALWYGYEKLNKQYYNYLGSGQHYRIYNAFAPTIFKNNGTFKQPENVVSIELERECLTPCLPSEFTPSNLRVTELFKKGTEPTTVSNRFARLENVTTLDAKTDKGNVTLSWTPIKIPDAINESYLTDYFNSIYKNSSMRSSALQTRLSYNANVLGTIHYKIYKQKADNSLELITTTANSSVTFNEKSADVTYVVKTSYTIFTASESTGTSISVKNENVPSLITADFEDNISQLEIKIGDSFTEPKVIVYEDGLPVIDGVKTTKNGTYDITKVGTYELTYTVEYKNFTKTLKFKLIVKPKEG